MNNPPIARELVLAGGGHSHVVVLRMLAMHPIPGLRVTLISPETDTPYSGMLPGVVAGHYTRDQAHIDLVPMCRFAGAVFVKGMVEAVDTENRQVRVPGRPPIRYDLLSIDVGSTPSLGGLTGEAVIPVKPISNFLSRWEAFLARFAAGQSREVGFVGGGAGGAELCMAVCHYLRLNYPDHDHNLHLFTDGKTVLRDFPAGVRIRFERLMNDKGITIHRDFRAAEVTGNAVVSEDGRAVAIDDVFCTTQASAQDWPQAAGMSVDQAGFIKVRDTLQTVSHEDVFAVGDCATMVNHPRPKAGVFAVRQGMPLYRNIRALLLGEQPRPFKPQAKFLALLTTGPKHAVASRNGIVIDGDWVWRWKNWIDSRFMRRFQELPEMAPEKQTGLLADFDDMMHCGGCGAKVSADMLTEVLNQLMAGEVPADDAAPVAVPDGQQLIQSVDHLRSFIEDFYIQARIAVAHAFSDIYACGGKPLSTMVMLTLPFAKPDVTRGMLHQLMSGILDQLEQEGAALIGGHTSEGAELSIGLSVNGAVVAEQQWQKTGAQAGDRLILTKPLGTGVILAADMQHKARGAWVESALQSMMHSNRKAAEVLDGFPVNACTDVTGFGLAGHCQEMLAQGPVGLMLDETAIPLLPGTKACMAEGIRSTLHESNQRSAQAIDGQGADILFDPQTSGGLLIAVPAVEVDSCLSRLKEAGYRQAAIIGEFDENVGVRLKGQNHG